MPLVFSSSETSNRDWPFQFEVKDDDGNLIDFTGAYIAISIYDERKCEIISATTDPDNAKVVIVSPGIITMTIPYSETNVCPGTYNVGGYYQLNGETIDLLDGTISVREGYPKP